MIGTRINHLSQLARTLLRGLNQSVARPQRRNTLGYAACECFEQRLLLAADILVQDAPSAIPSATSRIGSATADLRGGLVVSLDIDGNRSFDSTDLKLNLGIEGDTIVVGDWNGDGVDEIGFARPNNFGGGLTIFLDYNGNYLFEYNVDNFFSFGLKGDIVFAGDWTGSGRDRIGVARPNGSGGLTAFLDSDETFTYGDSPFDPTKDAVFNFGLEGDTIIVGDWNGNGVDSLGVVRPNGSGGLAIALDSNDSFAFEGHHDSVFKYGLAHDKIIVGDWNGDGTDGIAAVRIIANHRSPIFTRVFVDQNEDFVFDGSDVPSVFDLPYFVDEMFTGNWENSLPT